MQSITRHYAIVFVGMLALLICGTGWSQVERASITGTVTDSSGAVLTGATVKVTNNATDATVTFTTDSAGLYVARNLNPGSYTITVSKNGFSTHIDNGFTVQVSQAARLDVKLSVGSVVQAVQVSSALPMMQTENASVGQVLNAQAISSLPLNGRNIVELSVIAPGVTGLSAAPGGTISSGSRPDELRPGGTTLIANGSEDGYNKMMLDGVDNTEQIAQTFVVRPSIGGISEFNVITSNAGAEYDRGAGAIIVTSTQSGGNHLHGTVFEYLRNSYVDAKNYFDHAAGPTPPYKLNDLGGGVGGPIIRDKAFFFADYEGYFERLASTVVSTVPTMAMRQGNFSGVAHIFDPTTTQPNGVGGYSRTEFANDTIPAAEFDPIAAQIVALYPLPQTSTLVNNYVSNPVKATAENRADARIDYSLPFNQNVFARYSVDNAQFTMPNTYNSVIGGNEGQFSGNNSTVGQNMVVGDNIAINSQLAAEYRLGLTKFTSFFLASPLSAPVWQTIIGAHQGIPNEPSAPIISPSGYGGLGDSRSEPQIRLEHTIENMGDVSWIRGRHSMKFGFDVLHNLFSEPSVVPGQSTFGRFNFDNTLTDNPATSSGGNAIATMLLGFPSTTARFFYLGTIPHVLGNELNFYAQDTWQAGKRLTLNLGAHYQVDTAYRERKNQWANFDVATAQVIIAGQNGVGPAAGVNTDYGAIAPRFGFDYRFSEKLVLRGAYGIYFDPQAAGSSIGRQEIQWPFAFTYSLVPGSIFPGNRVSQGFLNNASLPPGEFDKPFGVLSATDFHFKSTSAQEINLSLQQQLSSRSTVSLTYGGSLGRHRSWSDPIDQPAPGPGNIQARRPYDALYPNVTGITLKKSIANSAYNSMQISYEDRMDHGLTLGGNYVWSHSLDNSGGDGGTNGPVPQDPTNFRADWGSSDNDAMNRVNLYGTYDLPFGPGKAFLNQPTFLNKYALGGWKMDGIALMQSGYPFTVTTSAQPTNTGVAGRANVVPAVPSRPANQSVTKWFNPAAFSVPAPYQWGDSARNSLRGPDNINLDFTAAKVFPIAEAKNLEFRSEFFNIFNHPQFAVPAATIGSTGVATITSTTHSSRQIQFVLKLNF